MLKSCLTSLLDTDLYKFTMMQCVWHHFKDSTATYRLKCRHPISLRPYRALFEQEIQSLAQLRLQEKELQYLQTLPYFQADFINFLRDFQLKTHYIRLIEKEELEIHIEGPWVDTILFEVPLLAIIHQVFYQENYPHFDFQEGQRRLQEKIQFLQQPQYQGFRFADFGTRRRFSKDWHAFLLNQLKEALPQQWVGTSNIYFSQKLRLPPLGTMAHEFLQACQVLAPHLIGSQQFALRTWRKEYHDQLGIALTDVMTMDRFLKEFDEALTHHYAGLRHDSGDPFEWGEKALLHYKSFGIDPRSKIFVFSDSLNFQKATAIYEYFKDKCQPFFGIGTYLTNDVGVPPLDIVIKMTHLNGQPVVKISDSPGKIVCEDAAFLQKIKKTFHLQG